MKQERLAIRHKMPLFFYVLLIPFFKPAYFDTLPFLDFAFNLLRLGATAIVLLYVAAHNRLISKTSVAFLSMQGTLFISTLINHHPIYDFVRDNVLQIGAYFLLCILAQKPKRTVRFLFHLSEVLVFTNLVCMLVFPDGMYISQLLGYYHNWLLGYKNQLFPFLILASVACAMYTRYEKPSIRPYVLLFAILLTLYLAKSRTSFAATGVFVVLWWWRVHRKHSKWNPYVFFAVSVLLFLGLVIFKGYRLAELLTNKPVSFSDRTIFWSRIEELVSQKPFLGWGVMSASASIQITGLAECTHAHNTILQVLYTGGFVGFFFYMWFLVTILRKLKKAHSRFMQGILLATLFALSISCLTEVYASALVTIIYAIAENSELFSACDNNSFQKDSIINTYCFQIKTKSPTSA